MQHRRRRPLPPLPPTFVATVASSIVIHRGVASKRTHFIVAATAADRRRTGSPQPAARRESPKNEREIQCCRSRTIAVRGVHPLLLPSSLPPRTVYLPNYFVVSGFYCSTGISLFRFNYGGLAPRCCRLCFGSRGQSRCGYTRIP